MEIDIDVYFWLVDRGVYDDDQRNKVDLERNKVRMQREHSQKLENGFYVAKLMMILKKSVVKISRKPFSLDPNLANMKDNITSTSKQMNWAIIAKELKKFGIKIDSEKKAKIIEGSNQIICEVLQRLFEFDNGGGQGRIQGDGTSSEINFNGDRDNSLGQNPNESTNISVDGKESSIILGLSNQKHKSQLDPLSPARRSQKRKSKLPINLGNSPNIKKMKVNQSVTSLNDLNEGRDLSETETTLEFILLGLAKSLGIKPKQAAGLLSNNHKYLIHIAVKGMKGGDFSKIIQWYQSIYGYTKHLTQLIDNEKEQNSMKLTLNILKCGLYSSNPDLLVTCSRVLSKLGMEIYSFGGQLAGLAWDWFVDNSGLPQQSNQMLDQHSSDNSFAREISPTGTMQIPPNIINESGLSSCLYAMRRQQTDAIDSVTPIIMHYGKNNYLEFFTYHLRRHFTGEQQRLNYISAVHDITMVVAGTQIFQESLVNSGALDDLVSQAIRMADYDQNGANSPKERVTAMAFLADVWEVNSDRIEENHEVAQAILTVVKRGCRDRSKILRTVSFEQMFKLLQYFSVSRNQYAPIIYKSLTFLLIEFHQNVEVREQLMRQFVTLFQQVQTIPVAILCEPLLKQISITSVSLVDFNIFDFEFFGIVANHKRSTINIGLQIIDVMVAQATTQVFYANSATSIVLELVHRFSREQLMHQHMSQVTEELIHKLDESERWKKANASSLDIGGSPSNSLRKGRTVRNIDPQQTEQQSVALAKKMKERLIVNFLKQVIMFGIELIKENIRTQLLKGYAKLEHSAKIKQPKSFHYLVQLYTAQDPSVDVPQMLQHYIDQEKQRSRKAKALLPPPQLSLENSLDDYMLADHNSVNGESGLLLANHSRLAHNKPLTKAQIHLDKAIRDIEKIKTNKNEKTDKKMLEEELRRLKDEQLKVSAKKQVERRQIEHGVLPLAAKKPNNLIGGVTRGVSVDQRTMNHQPGTLLDKDGQPLEIKIIKARDVDDLSVINQNTSIDHHDPQKAKSKVLKQLKEFQLYDLRLEEQKDQDAVRFFVKKQLKVLKLLFAKYANTSGPINTSGQTFDELQKNNHFMTVAEALKMNKDFQVSTLQCSQKDLLQMFRAINKDILKKKDNSGSTVSATPQPGSSSKQNSVIPQNAIMTALDFEGFVEFLLQLAVHLYSYDCDLTPVEYLQRLFDNFGHAAAKNNSNLAKLFQGAASAEEGQQLSGVMDTKLIAELNKRLAIDPNTKLPEGYQKVTEKEIEMKYVVPSYFPMSEGKRISIEVLDGLFNKLFGVHLLEPMSEMKEYLRARPILKHMTRDKVMSEITTNNASKGLAKPKTTRPDAKISHSIDSLAPALPKKPLPRDSSKADLSKNPLQAKLTQPVIQAQPQPVPVVEPPKPALPTFLRLEVAQTKAPMRPYALEAAYCLEEILTAVDQRLPNLPRLMPQQSKKPANKIIEERQKKLEEEEMKKKDERAKLDMRKKLLKEELDKMKVEKEKKDKEAKLKEKEKKDKQEEVKKKKQEKLVADMEKLKQEFSQKRELKQKEEEEKKANEKQQDPVDPAQKAADNKANLKMRKQAMIEQLQKKTDERKEKEVMDQEKKIRKENREKAKAQQIKQMYQDNKTKAQELKERYRDEYNVFKDSINVQNMYKAYDKALSSFFELYTKFDGPVAAPLGNEPTLSYQAYMNMGKKLIFPMIVSSQDYVYIYKSLMKQKKNAEKSVKYETITDVQGTKLTLSEFKEALLRVACLGKFKLGGGPVANEEELKEQKQRQKEKMKQALKDASQGGVLKKPRDEDQDGHVNEDLVNIFEKEFDVADMTQQTLENLFKQIGLKPDKIPQEKNSPRLNPKAASQAKIQDNNSKKQPLNLKVSDSYQDEGAMQD